MRQSRFINLTSYCIAEYLFEPLNSNNFQTADFKLIENKYLGTRQIFNTDSHYHSTKNIQDLTCVPVSDNTSVYLDSEKSINYLDWDSNNFTITDIPNQVLVLDKIRFHFISGFELTDFKALILSLRNTENSGTQNIFTNILLSPETYSELVTYNPRPMFLGSGLYDRYIDILVPSIKNINEEYITSLTPNSTFAGLITPTEDGTQGFVYNSQIVISLSECGTRGIVSTSTPSLYYDSFQVTDYFESTLSQTNEFDLVGAEVNESTQGDYIEFYLTYNSGFPDELIAILNRRNPSDDWIVMHQLSIFEQIGSAFINTSKLIVFQEDKFDEPNIFRPVLKNANEAVSMAIDYVARLTNRRNGEQIIREASYSLVSPKKYGKSLINIQLQEKPQSHKVYNKILKNNFEASSLFVEDQSLVTSVSVQTVTSTQVVVQTEYVPVFFNSSNISVSNISSLITSSDSSQEVIFGQNQLRFILAPFDNVIKLKVYTTSNKPSGAIQIPLDLNLTAAKYRLLFETDNGKISIDHTNDPMLDNLSTGVINFKLSKKDSESIVKSINQTVYLTSVGQDGNETLMYTGEWRLPSQQKDIDDAISKAKSASKQDESIKSSISTMESLAKFTDIPFTPESKNLSLGDEIAVVPMVNRFGVPNSRSINVNYKNVNK